MRLLTLLLCVPVLASAQAVPTDFPADSQLVGAEALRAAIVGKTFNIKPAQGGSMRVEYRASGWIFVATSQGYRDTGSWRIDGEALCATWQRAASGCSEVRLKDNVLYVRRASNHEVVALLVE